MNRKSDTVLVVMKSRQHKRHTSIVSSARVALLALVALLAVASLGCEDEAITDRFQLFGVVRNRTSGARVSGVTVTFTSDTLFRASARTNGDGFYEMAVETDVPFGQVRATRDGFLPSETTVFFDTPERRIDLELRPE